MFPIYALSEIRKGRLEQIFKEIALLQFGDINEYNYSEGLRKSK